MNWNQILANVIGAAVACLTAHSLAGAGLGVITDRTAWMGVALCIGSNLAGLFQSSPTTPPASSNARA